MHILVDCLSLGYGGSETYLREILPRLAGIGNQLTVLMQTGTGLGLRQVFTPNTHVFDAPAANRNPFYRHHYQRSILPRVMNELRADVLYCPGGISGTARDARFKRVVMFQNMLPFEPAERRRYDLIHYPYMRFRLRLLSRGLVKSGQNADRIIYISEFSKSVISKQLPSVDSRVVYHGIAPFPEQNHNETDSLLEELGIHKPYLLYLSILDPYKHQDVVVRGFCEYVRRSARSDVSLVLAGPIVGAYGKKVVKLAKATECKIHCIGAVPHASVKKLLSAAEILLFGSTCECCPFILLEYMAAGRPIISSNKLPMPEVAGDTVRYVNALDPNAWAAEIVTMLGSPDQMNMLGSRARERSRVFSWDETARRTTAALTEW